MNIPITANSSSVLLTCMLTDRATRKVTRCTFDCVLSHPMAIEANIHERLREKVP